METHHRNLASYSNVNSGLETIPFGIDMVNVTHLWDIEPKLERVKICVIDTGYDLGHEDLPNNVTVEHGGVTGWNNAEASQGVWNIDGHSHGTHCAGTIGAIGNNDSKCLIGKMYIGSSSQILDKSNSYIISLSLSFSLFLPTLILQRA